MPCCRRVFKPILHLTINSECLWLNLKKIHFEFYDIYNIALITKVVLAVIIYKNKQLLLLLFKYLPLKSKITHQKR